MKELKYVEPADYFPKDVQKLFDETIENANELQLDVIVEKAVGYIQKLSANESTTMYKVIKVVVPDEVEKLNTGNLLEIYYLILDKVKENNIQLDFDNHTGKDTGMPFSLEFVIKSNIF